MRPSEPYFQTASCIRRPVCRQNQFILEIHVNDSKIHKDLPAFCRSAEPAQAGGRFRLCSIPLPYQSQTESTKHGVNRQKYGRNIGRFPRTHQNVANRVAKARAEGHDVVVVVSAMSGETNRLVALAHEMQEHPDPRELDVVLATGEQVTIGLLAMALKNIGVDAKSYTGWQVALKTDTAHTKARIESIDDEKMRADLAAGKSSS